MTRGGRFRRRLGQKSGVGWCWLAAAMVPFFAAACSPQNDRPAPGPDPARTLPRLHTEGRNLADEQGNVVVLRGVNLGSWLFHETWISGMDYPVHSRLHVLGNEMGIGDDVDAALRQVGPEDGEGWILEFQDALQGRAGPERTAELLSSLASYPSIYDDSDLPLRGLLETRFGTGGRDELLDVFQTAWIREPDIVWIASQGFNVVRVPIGYRTLVTGSDLDPLTGLDWNERAFAQIERLLRWCETYGVYAVIDIQEAPGGQNDYSGPARLYDDPLMQALTLELWQELSRRYRHRSVVAAYSLLAEPFGAPSIEVRDGMFDRIVRTVREQGDDHALIIHDGFFGLWTLPDPGAMGWDGVIYSTHLFEFGVESLSGYRLLAALYDALFNAAQTRQDVPYYIGSFSTMVDEDYAYEAAELLLDLYERSGWSWSLWTYKRIDDPIEAELFGKSTSWGLRGRLGSDFERPDVYRDGLDDLRRKFEAYGRLVLLPNERLLGILRYAAGQTGSNTDSKVR
jgi:hypothetical protein